MADLSSLMNPDTPPSNPNMSDNAQQQQASVEKDGDPDVSMLDGSNDARVKKEKTVEPSNAALAAQGLAPSSRDASSAPTPAEVRGTMPSILTDNGTPLRQYVNKHLTPYILEGMKQVCKERDAHPLRTLGAYLLACADELEPPTSAKSGSDAQNTATAANDEDEEMEE